jgi:hypothetical protein
MQAVERIAALATGAFVCALVAGFAMLLVHTWTLPPTDLAHGMTVSETLRDPAVLMVWCGLVLVGGVLGFLISLWPLWRSDLARSIPRVGIATLVGGVLATSLNASAGLLAAFVSGFAAMLWCRSRFPGVPDVDARPD